MKKAQGEKPTIENQKSDQSDAPPLKDFIEKIERMNEEKAAISADIRDTFNAAKGVGYDPKAMRILIRHRNMDRAEVDEEEANVHLYKQALEREENAHR